jgi:hypothetical protein
MAAAAWAVGDEVDVLAGSGCGGKGPCCWWPGTIVGSEEEGARGCYRVRLKGAAGGLSPPRGCTPAPQEEAGVTPGRLAPAGRHVPRWRLCGGDALVEVKVRVAGCSRVADRLLASRGARADRGGFGLCGPQRAGRRVLGSWYTR